MKFYKYLSYSLSGLLIILVIYVCIIFSYRAIKKNTYDSFYREQQNIALKNVPFNQDFLPPKNIPANKPVRILVLEGGGVRGILSAKILDFMEKTSHKRISDLFDAIYGTSIGGVQAVFLTVPGKDGKAKYTAADLVNFMRNDAPPALAVSNSQAILSGFGLVSPLIDSRAYIKLLKGITGNTQFSQLTNTVVLPGYDLEKNEITFFSSRQDIPNQPNFLLYQLLSGTTAVVGLFPPQKVYSISSNQNYLLSDPGIFINNPILAALLHADIMYPKNEKIVVFIGLGLSKSDKKTDFFNGLISGAYQYFAMVNSGSSDKLLNLYLDILESGHRLGLKSHDEYFINIPVDASMGVSFNASPKNISHLEKVADSIIVQEKSKLLQAIDRLTASVKN